MGLPTCFYCLKEMLMLLLFSLTTSCPPVCEPHGLQHTSMPCPLLSLKFAKNSCPLSWWCPPIISSSVLPVYSWTQSFPGWRSCLLSLFLSGNQSIGVSALASVLSMNIQGWFPFSLVQSPSCVWLFETPCTTAHQASLSITNTGVCSDSSPLSWWCHSTISSSVVPFSSCVQSFPAWGFFPSSQFFASGDQNIGVSASASVLPVNIQD